MLTIGDFNSFWVFLGTVQGLHFPVQGVPKNPKTIENVLLLEFQCLALN